MRLQNHILVSILATVGLSAGCSAPFLHSASDTGPAIEDGGLVGEWLATGSTTTRAVIGQQVEGRYPVALTVHQDGVFKSSLALDVSLTEIGGARYWDLFLNRAERDKLVGAYGFLVVPTHQVMKIERAGDEFRVWSFSGAWLEDAARSGKYSHDRVVVGGGEVAMITAPTEQVRDLIARHGNDPNAFGEPVMFRRVAK